MNRSCLETSRRRPQWLIVLALGSTLAGLTCGCAGGGAGGKTEELVKVNGTVTFNGQPLTKGTVSFVPADAAKSPATGEIDSSGKFLLSTHAKDDGVAPGSYKITIAAWDTEPTMNEAGTPVPGKPAIPEKYFDVEKSGLTATVETGKSSQDVSFSLTP